MSKTKTDKWYRVGKSGPTVDGRYVDPEQLKQAAEDYDPQNKYGARINVEHFRSFWPNSDLSGYGDILALKTETKAEKDGEFVYMLAQLDPTKKLIDLNAKREKVYSSMELLPNFAGTGRAYLVGLAVTDTPASLGTEMLKFSQGNPVLTSESIDMTQDFKDGQSTEAGQAEPEKQAVGFFSGMLNKLSGDSKRQDLKVKANSEELEAAGQVVEILSKKVEELEGKVDKFTSLAADFEALKAENAKLTELTEKFAASRATEPREKHQGANNAVDADFY